MERIMEFARLDLPSIVIKPSTSVVRYKNTDPSNPQLSPGTVSRRAKSSYASFIRKIANTDIETVKEISKETAVELFKRGRYSKNERDVVIDAVADELYGLPADPTERDRILDEMFENDAKMFQYYQKLNLAAEHGVYEALGDPRIANKAASPKVTPNIPDKSIRKIGESIKTNALEHEMPEVFVEEVPLTREQKEQELRDYFVNTLMPNLKVEKVKRLGGLWHPETLVYDSERSYKEVFEPLYEKYNDEKEGGKKFVHSVLKNLKGKMKKDSQFSKTDRTKENLLKREVEKNEKIYRRRNLSLFSAGLMAVAAVSYTGIKLVNQPTRFDSDRDDLLNGDNETLPKDSGKAKEYISAGIYHRVNSDGTYTFFGEKSLGSDSTRPSPAAVDQALFLSAVSQSDYDKIKADGNLANFNIDSDSWSNRFEQLTGSPYNVKNDIYAIVMTMSGHEYKPVDEMFKILEKMKIPKDHVYGLSSDKNNSTDFAAAANSIAQVSDKNDSVLIIMNGDGGHGIFAFMDKPDIQPPVPYTWFKGRIDNIPSKNKVIVIDACYSGSAIKDLQGENKIILTNATDNQKSGFGIGYNFLKALSNPLADTDNSGYVSMGEAAEYAKMMETFEARQAQLSDIGSIGKTSYLFEQSVG
jgi:hypothetical protein